jgi:hypothetical protein
MRNYLHDEDSQDIYLEVAILVTDEKQAPRQALLEVRPTESESPGHGLFGVVIMCPHNTYSSLIAALGTKP